jgi:predicted transcriptional regulator of viral defense system
LQVPSYISFASALSYYEVTTQVQRKFFESVSLKRSKKIKEGGVEFDYYKFKKEYYFDFNKIGDFFIASKEKALVDALYLCSLGRYKIDFSALDFNKLDSKKLKKVLKSFPKKVSVLARKICRI